MILSHHCPFQAIFDYCVQSSTPRIVISQRVIKTVTTAIDIFDRWNKLLLVDVKHRHHWLIYSSFSALFWEIAELSNRNQWGLRGSSRFQMSLKQFGSLVCRFTITINETETRMKIRTWRAITMKLSLLNEYVIAPLYLHRSAFTSPRTFLSIFSCRVSNN